MITQRQVLVVKIRQLAQRVKEVLLFTSDTSTFPNTKHVPPHYCHYAVNSGGVAERPDRIQPEFLLENQNVQTLFPCFTAFVVFYILLHLEKNFLLKKKSHPFFRASKMWSRVELKRAL